MPIRDTATVGEWTVNAVVDSDGHLTLWLTHTDKTAIMMIEEDFGERDGECQLRFTTSNIERTQP
jgi:hypothetical protein